MKKKFRGKRVDNGKWIYGGLCVFGFTIDIFDCNTIDNGSYEVEEKTVGQLIDVINDVEIYEDDIVEAYKYNEEKVVNRVNYLDGCYMFGSWNWHEFLNKFRRVKVIGNTHDNKFGG